MKTRARSSAFALAVCFSCAAGLSAQDGAASPDPCAGAGAPRRAWNVAAFSSDGVTTLRLAAGPGIRLRNEMREVERVCEGAGDKLVVFGTALSRPLYNVAVIEADSGALVDSFLAYSPTLSPDGR